MNSPNKPTDDAVQKACPRRHNEDGHSLRLTGLDTGVWEPCPVCANILAYGKAQRLAALNALLEETLEYQKACGDTVMYGGDALAILRDHIRALGPPESGEQKRCLKCGEWIPTATEAGTCMCPPEVKP